MPVVTVDLWERRADGTVSPVLVAADRIAYCHKEGAVEGDTTVVLKCGRRFVVEESVNTIETRIRAAGRR